ncbi:MAG: hypothetical protein KDA16_09605 [Phycisphaerales bacterium]|nr:hypothetical protein [Phycisphaerales bacterium]
MALRRRVYQIVEVAAPNDRISRIFDLSIISLIILNVAAMILESVPSIRAEW